MIKRILPAFALLALTACSIPEGSSAVLRQTAIAQIELLNAAGVDPVQMDKTDLAIASSACSMVVAVVTVWDTSVPDAPQTVIDFCAVILKAGGTATPPAEPAA